jgi:hypothetical protein
MWLADPHEPAKFVIEVLGSQMFSMPHHTHLRRGLQKAIPATAHVCSWGSLSAKKLSQKSTQDYLMVNERADKKEPARKS